MKLLSQAGLWLGACFVAKSGDNPWLDMLRTLAIALVLLRHGQRALLSRAERAELGVFDFLALNGWVGVDLFFVLSGYLVGTKLLAPRTAANPVMISVYLLDRARRILPAYLAVLAITVMGVFPGFAVSGDNLSWRILYHLLFLQDVLPSDINVVFWSLGVEVKFYIALPLVAYLLLRMRTKLGQISLIAVIVAVGGLIRISLYMRMDQPVDYVAFWSTLRSPFYTSLEPLFLGTAIALLTTKGAYLAQSTAKGLLAGLLLGSAIWFSSGDFMGTISLWDASYQPLALALIFSIAVWAAASLKNTKLWAEPFFRIMARLSYSLYLVHFPLLPLALYLGGTGTPTGTMVFWSVLLATSLSLSVFIYVIIERPFLRPRSSLQPASVQTSTGVS